MSYYVLFYHVVGDYVARRAAYREEHLRLAREAHRRGELLLGGALSDPVGALLVFRAERGRWSKTSHEMTRTWSADW
jgi:hypothetical protein